MSDVSCATSRATDARTRSDRSPVTSFLDFNRRWSARIARRWPYRGTRIFDLYPELVVQEVQPLRAPVIGDVGAGAESHFGDRLPPGARVIGVDVSAPGLARNPWLTERRVADVTANLPFDEQELDLMVSHAVLEHLRDVPAFMRRSRLALKPGGHAIHLFSTRAAPFAVINRILPPSFARRVLYRLHPDAIGTQGFPAYYDHCSHDAILATIRKVGLEVHSVRVSYRTSQYFDFLAPLFAVARAYEQLLARLDARQLASYVLVVCRRPPAEHR